MGVAVLRSGMLCAPSEAGKSSANAAASFKCMRSAVQSIDSGLERGKLRLQLFDVAVGRLRFGLRLAAERAARILEHRHVALGEIGEDIAAEGILDRALV